MLKNSTSLEKLALTAQAEITTSLNLDCAGLQAVTLTTGNHTWTGTKGMDYASGATVNGAAAPDLSNLIAGMTLNGTGTFKGGNGGARAF